MFDTEELIGVLTENIKKLFFQEWINLDLKFSKSEIFTILLIDKNKEITMSELAENINAPMSTATGIADRLVKNHYLKRERSQEDRRIVVLRLTDKGSQIVKDLKDMISKYLNRVMDDLTAEEKQFLGKIAFKIIDILQSHKDPVVSEDQKTKEIKTIDIE